MKIWIYLDGAQQGPFSPEELVGMPGLVQDTLVWFEGLPKWYRAGDLAQMQAILDGSYCTAAPASDTVDPEATADDTTETSDYTDATTTTDTDTEVDVSGGRVYYAPEAVVNVAARPASNCPPTYLGWSVFLLICCCSPLSLGALIASICVSSYYSRGNMAKARKASEWAAWLIMIAFALGMIPVMIMSALMN